MKAPLLKFCLTLFFAVGFLYTANAQENAREQTSELENEALVPSRINQAFGTPEPNKKARIVGDETIAAPNIKLPKTLRRLPDAPSARRQIEEVEQRKKQLKEKSYRTYKRPIILAAGVFRSGDQEVKISNIITTKRDAICQSQSQSQKGEWPCGNFAKAALQRLVKTKPILCEAAKDAERLNGTIVENKCKVGAYYLDEWLVKNGWADTNHSAFFKMRDNAKSSKLGIWRD